MPTPLAQALLICDAVHRDRTTGKFFLLGTFSTITAPSLPCQPGPMCLFIVVTECRGKTPLTIRLIRIDPGSGEDIVLQQMSAQIDSPDPLAVHELALHLREISFASAGEHRFQLFSGSTLLIEKRVVVVHRPPASPPEG